MADKDGTPATNPGMTDPDLADLDLPETTVPDTTLPDTTVPDPDLPGPDFPDKDLAGYDHSQTSGTAGNGANDHPSTTDTYRDKDHDGGWSSQVAMDDFEDRSGGDAYDRMSRGIMEDTYGRGPDGLGADAPPKKTPPKAES